MYEGFQERIKRRSKKKTLPKCRWNFRGQEKQYNQLSRKEDEDILYDKYSMENESEKKENEIEEGEINSETEMDEVSYGNEVGEVERVKNKKEQGVLREKKSSQDKFSDKRVTSLGRKLAKQYGIDHKKEKHMKREEGWTSIESENYDNKIENSEASFKVENQKSENHKH